MKKNLLLSLIPIMLLLGIASGCSEDRKEIDGAQSVSEYRHQKITVLEEQAKSLEAFNILFKEAANDASITSDPEWRETIEAVLSILDRTTERILKLRPPEKYKESHEHLVDMVNHYRPLINGYFDAATNHNTERINELMDEFEKGNESIDKAIEATNRIE